MFIRTRNTNLSLERPLYSPAVRAEDGSLVQKSRRSTLYLGSVSTKLPFSQVPKELLDRLTDDEKSTLRNALKTNELPRFQWLVGVPERLSFAGQTLTSAVADAELMADPFTKHQLQALLDRANASWLAFLDEAKVAGFEPRSSPK